MSDSSITISYNTPEYLPYFKSINEEWINEMFVLEQGDSESMDHAQRLIVDAGGSILYAHHAELGVVGTCALRKRGEGAFELTKMGVLKKARGLGVGVKLLLAVIDTAQRQKIHNLFLLTNKKCETAIHLYETYGFKHDEAIMADYGKLYQRCDVAMRYKPN